MSEDKSKVKPEFVPKNKPASAETFCKDLMSRMVRNRDWVERYEKETGKSVFTGAGRIEELLE